MISLLSKESTFFWGQDKCVIFIIDTVHWHKKTELRRMIMRMFMETDFPSAGLAVKITFRIMNNVKAGW